MTTAHSEFGQLKSVFIKTPMAAFRSQENLNAQWKLHNFLRAPDYAASIREYERFVEILRSEGAGIFEFPEDPATTIDSMYCRDASIHTDAGIILCNMGKQQRLGEPEAARRAYEIRNDQILGAIESPGTVEGGDVAWLDEQTLAVGCGYRTNPNGIHQLQQLLAPLGVQVVPVDLPHYRGPGDVFHLMSIFSPVDNNLAVVYSPLMPVRFRNYLLERNMDLVQVPEQEFDSMGCNVLAIAPRVVMIEEHNPVTIQRLKDKGCRVLTFDGSHICVPGGGGPTCLTRPVSREV